MWKKPWKYKEGFAIALGMVMVGLLLQLSIGPLDWAIFLWPGNIICLALLVLLLVAAQVVRKQVYLVRFAASARAAVPAIVVCSVLTVVMGLVAQAAPHKHVEGDPLGLSHMLGAWHFVLAWLWLTMIVGLVALQRVAHVSWRTLPALLAHVGLFVVLTCGVLGSADMHRLKMFCEQGQPEWRGLDDMDNVHELPLAIELNKFTIKEYPPKIIVIDPDGNALPHKKPAYLLADAQLGSGEIEGWQVTVTKRLDAAIPVAMQQMVKAMPGEMMGRIAMDSLGHAMNKDGYVASDADGAAQALQVRASKDGTQVEGWIACGSYRYTPQTLELAGGLRLALSSPEPERYSSDVNVYTPDGRNIHAEITVNNPLEVDGWKIYQYSYNQQMGKWSKLSVFELVCDPWLPAVYVGLYLLMASAVLLFVTSVRSPRGGNGHQPNEKQQS